MVRKERNNRRALAHQILDKKAVPCKFVLEGKKCRKGDLCPFSHDPAILRKYQNNDDDTENHDNDGSRQHEETGAKRNGGSKDWNKKDQSDGVESSDGEDEHVDWSKEDEFGKYALNDKLDVRLFEVLHAIRNDDPTIFDKEKTFFEGLEPGESDSEIDHDDKNLDEDDDNDEKRDGQAIGRASKMKKLLASSNIDDPEVKKKKKEMILKFFNSQTSASENINNDGAKHSSVSHPPKTKDPQSIMSDSDEENDQDNDGDFFEKKEKSKEELERENSEYKEFLERQESSNTQNLMEETAALTRYMGSEENLSEEDKFLRDYLLNNGWINGVDGIINNNNNNNAVASDANDVDIEQFEEEDEELELIEKHETDIIKSKTLMDMNTVAPTKEIIQQYSERRKKLTKRHRDRLRRNQVYKEKRKEIEDELDEKKKVKQREIFDLIIELKKLIKGDGSAIDKLKLESAEKDFEEKIDSNTVYEELHDLSRDEEDESNENGQESNQRTSTLVRKELRKCFDEYYKLHYQDFVLYTPVRFQYNRVEKDDSLSVLDILTMEDEELEKVKPIRDVKSYDGLSAPKLKKYHDRNSGKQYTTRANYKWDGKLKKKVIDNNGNESTSKKMDRREDKKKKGIKRKFEESEEKE